MTNGDVTLRLTIRGVTIRLTLHASELTKGLGVSQPLTSHLLTGKRNLTVAHMQKPGSHFKIDPEYFL